MEGGANLPTAGSIMTADVITLDSRLGLVEAAERLLQHEVSNAPVVTISDGRSRLRGFVSERDLMQSYASGEFYRDSKLTVADVMRVHPVAVRAEADLFTVAAIFMQHDYRHLPVVEDGALVGMVARRDVLRALLGHYQDWCKLDPGKRRAPDLERLFAHRFIVG